MPRSINFILSFCFVCFLSASCFCQEKPGVIPLWSSGAPGFESRRNIPEEAKDYWVKNIHNPSITVFLPPKEKANGTAVIICPGGGHRLLVYDAEGRDAAVFLNSLGVAAFVLKYRLAREDSLDYHLEKEVRQDAYRAMRLVRSKYKEFGIDTARTGIMGFSAGGEVVAQIAYRPGWGDPSAPDPIDRLNGRPDFQILVYPGPYGIPDSVSSSAPPAFLVVANDDPCCSTSTLKVLEIYRAAKAPVEAHFFTKGNHGFNMGKRSNLTSIKTWPQRLADWLADSQLLSAEKK